METLDEQKPITEQEQKPITEQKPEQSKELDLEPDYVGFLYVPMWIEHTKTETGIATTYKINLFGRNIRFKPNRNKG